jgi:hypothetical protein
LGYKNKITTDSAFIKEKVEGADLPKTYQALILKNVEAILKKEER